MSCCIIFYSRDGSTRKTAEMLRSKLDADLLELKELKPSRNFFLSGYRSITKKRRALAGDPWGDCAGYDTLIIGSPIWAENGSPVVNSFLDKADLKGKRVFLFTLQAAPNLSGSDRVLSNLAGRVREQGGEVIDTRAFHGARPGKTVPDNPLQERVEDWKIE